MGWFLGWFLLGKAMANAFCCLDGSCFRAMYQAALNLPFVTGLGQCHCSATPRPAPAPCCRLSLSLQSW